MVRGEDILAVIKVFLPAMGNRGKNNVNYWPETGYYRSSTGASGSVAIIWSLIRAMLLRITIIGIGMLSR
mgnify:CR=1 FL=1